MGFHLFKYKQLLLVFVRRPKATTTSAELRKGYVVNVIHANFFLVISKPLKTFITLNAAGDIFCDSLNVALLCGSTSVSEKVFIYLWVINPDKSAYVLLDLQNNACCCLLTRIHTFSAANKWMGVCRV